DRLLARLPGAIYVTHFGQVTDVQRRGADLHRLVDGHAQLGLACRDAGPQRAERLREGVRQMLLAEAKRQDWPITGPELLALCAIDFTLIADGIASWLDAMK